MTIVRKGTRWALAFVVFWAANVALWYIIHETFNFCNLGTPVPVTWRFAASDTWGWAAGEVAGVAIGLRIKQKREQGKRSSLIRGWNKEA